MREIKVRAFYKGQFFYFTVGQLWNVAMIETYCELVINGVPFEQFTGLHDKNGREIYEGDISLHDALPGAKDGLPVVYADCSIILKGKIPSDTIYLAKYSGLSMEIIGNIHEKEQPK